MAESMYAPPVVSAPPVDVRVKFWNITDWDPYQSRESNGVHVVQSGDRAGVYLADGKQLTLLNKLPVEEAVSFGNTVLRSLVSKGFVDGLYLPDELRSGDVRELQPGRAVLLNGSSQSLRSTNSHATPATFSAATWIYPAAVNVQRAIFSNRSSGNLFIGVNNATLFVYGGSAATSGNVLTATTWQHVGYSYDSTSIRFYVNGVLVATVPWTFTPSASAAIDIGYDAALPAYYNCRLSEAFYAPGQVLTPTNFVSLFNHAFVPINSANGFFYKLDDPDSELYQDSSGNGNHAIASGWSFAMNHTGNDVPISPQNQFGWSPSDPVNKLTQPNDFSHAAWTKRGTCAVVANQEYAPDGTLTADRINGLDAGANDIFNADHLGITGGMPAGTRSRSVWIKKISNAGVLFMSDPVDGYGRLDIDLALLPSGWHHIDPSSLRPLPAGVTRTQPEKSYAANNGGLLLRGVSGGPLSVYAWNAAVKNGYAVSRKESAPSTDNLGNALIFKKLCPMRPRKKQSNCVTLNGSNQYGLVGTGVWDTDGTEPMEVSFWFKTSDTGTQYVLCNMTSSGNYPGWIVTLEDGAPQIYLINTVSANELRVRGVAAFNDGTWHLGRFNYDGSKTAAGVALYVDAVRQATTTLNATLTGSTASPTAVACIGSLNATTSLTFNGSLADLRITIGKRWWQYKCAEGAKSGLLLDSGPFAAHATLMNYSDAMWTPKQDVVHTNITDGYRGGKNLLRHSKDFTQSSVWANLSSGTTTVTPNATLGVDGVTPATRLVGNDANTWYGQSSLPGEKQAASYCFSVWLKTDTTAAASIKLYPAGGTDPVANVNCSLTSAWQRFFVTTTWTTASFQNFGVINVGNGVNVYADRPQLELGTTPTDYHETSLLASPARTPRRDGVNLLRWSESLDNAVWVKNGTTVTPNTLLGPTGQLNADTWVNTTTGQVLYQSVQKAATAQEFTASLWVKKKTGDTITIRLVDNGAVIAGSTKTENIADGAWHRVTTTATSGTFADIRMDIVSTTNANEYYLAGAQLERSSTASAYMKTEDMPGPPNATTSLVDALGLPLTHPAGEWHNLAETLIDFTCGQPLAPEFNGSSPPSAYAAGTTVPGLEKHSLPNKERAYTLIKV